MVNFTLFIRKPVYEFLDSKNQIQLPARHQSDRKSIFIEYTKRKDTPPIDQCYINEIERRDQTMGFVYFERR